MTSIFTDSADIVRNLKTSAAGALCSRFPFLISLRRPPIVVVEASNICSLACPLCETVNSMQRPKGVMRIETFKRMLSQVSPFVRRMQFSFAGEPLMNENLCSMVEMATQKNISCKVDTNGVFLEKYARQLVDSGLQRINVALNGVDQETLSFYRKNSDFNAVVAGAKKLIEYRNKKNKAFPKAHMQFIVTKNNEDRLDEAVRLASNIGFDVIEFKSLSICLGDWIDDEKRSLAADLYLPENQEFLRYKTENGKWVLNSNLNRFCADIFTSAVVLWNGDVVLCCMDVEGKYKSGNILNEHFLKIWRCGTMNKLRSAILKKELPICKNCSLTSGHIQRVKLAED
ncbi:radical SAM protein [bacterium]|nr:MAG: radical SAM protein [bacterium]